MGGAVVLECIVKRGGSNDLATLLKMNKGAKGGNDCIKPVIEAKPCICAKSI